MKRAAAVALNTFREAVRDRVLYNLVFFALLMMAAAIFVGQISIGIEDMRRGKRVEEFFKVIALEQKARKEIEPFCAAGRIPRVVHVHQD